MYFIFKLFVTFFMHFCLDAKVPKNQVENTALFYSAYDSWFYEVDSLAIYGFSFGRQLMFYFTIMLYSRIRIMFSTDWGEGLVLPTIKYLTTSLRAERSNLELRKPDCHVGAVLIPDLLVPKFREYPPLLAYQ